MTGGVHKSACDGTAHRGPVSSVLIISLHVTYGNDTPYNSVCKYWRLESFFSNAATYENATLLSTVRGDRDRLNMKGGSGGFVIVRSLSILYMILRNKRRLRRINFIVSSPGVAYLRATASRTSPMLIQAFKYKRTQALLYL